MLLSICIPSYNRPSTLARLLESIDIPPEGIEIVISEDCSPKQNQIHSVVKSFQSKSSYRVIYHQNTENLGYDANLRQLFRLASGKFVMLMGDDDYFYQGSLAQFLYYLNNHLDAQYILRSYYNEVPDGPPMVVRYFSHTFRFPKGPNTCALLIKRSVTLCGVTFDREAALKYETNLFDGTLLYQVYLAAEMGLNENCENCDLACAVCAQTYRDDRPFFGVAKSERGVFEPGKITFQNSVNFTKGFFRITEFIDEKYRLAISRMVREDLSRYSYPFLSIQRKRGWLAFLQYVFLLARETGLNATWHFYMYAFALLVLGENACDKLIHIVIRRLGRLPQL